MLSGYFRMFSNVCVADVLTDQLAQIHRSPGFLSSVLTGVNDDGTIIKVFNCFDY